MHIMVYFVNFILSYKIDLYLNEKGYQCSFFITATFVLLSSIIVKNHGI